MLYKILTLTHRRVVLIKKKSVLDSFDTSADLENDLFDLKKSGKNLGISLFPGAQQP